MGETEAWAAETLAVFDRVGAAGEPLTTREVTEQLDCTRRAGYDRLQRLVDRGTLGTKKVGARGRIWWPTATPFTGATASAPTADDAEEPVGPSRSHRGHALKQYEAVVETIDDGVYIVDDESRFVFVNQAHAELTGYDRDELLGAHASLVTSDDDLALAEQRRDQLLTDDETVTTVETELCTKDGERVPIETRFALFRFDDGRVGRVGVVREITERKRHERELERYERIVETVTDGVYVLDDDYRFQMVNEAYTEMVERDRAELVGTHVSAVVDDQTIVEGRRRRHELATSDSEGTGVVEHELTTASGDTTTVETRFSLLPSEGSGVATAGVVRDITERRAYERQLETRIRQQEAVTQLGRVALECRDLDRLMRRAVEVVSETLGTDYCKVLDLTDDGAELLLRQGVGWDDGIVGEATVSAVDDDSQAAHTLRTERPIVVENLEHERRFSGPDLLTSHDVTSGISTIIGSFGSPWGILGTHDTDARTFTDHDVNFVQSVAHILSTAIDRHEYERELERQREQLAALNDLRSVISGVTEAVIAQSTREEIEQVVCDRLADAETYQFARVGALDRSLEAVRIKAASDRAVGEGATIDIGTRASSGYAELIDEAVRTRAVQISRRAEIEDWTVTHDAADGTASPFESLPEAAEAEIHSAAAIPIVHEEMVFGVVTVSTTRPEAFADGERASIDHLGETIGHAIASIERKRALMSDEMVALRYQTGDISSELGVSGGIDGTISIARTVPIDEGRYVSYGTVDTDAVEALETIVETESDWESLTVRDGGEGTKRFELVRSDPPVTSAVAAQGGEVVEASIVDGTARFEFHLPPGADVRAISEVVKAAYPGTRLVTRRQVTRVDPHIEHVLESTLTDRQRAALEASYHAGFFEWPRAASGEAVAETLGISPSTFHQHLRTAERKVLESLLSR